MNMRQLLSVKKLTNYLHACETYLTKRLAILIPLRNVACLQKNTSD